MKPCLESYRWTAPETMCYSNEIEENFSIDNIESLPKEVYDELAETARVFLKNMLDVPEDILSRLIIEVYNADINCEHNTCVIEAKARIMTPERDVIASAEIETHAEYYKEEGSAHAYSSYVSMNREDAQALYEYLLLKRAAGRAR